MTRQQRERRRDRRRTGVEDHGVLSARIVPGHHARLVDISPGGALVDTPIRLLPGTNVAVRLATRHEQIDIRGEVVRCMVARLAPLLYRGAVRFDRRLHLFEDREQQLPSREETTRGVF